MLSIDQYKCIEDELSKESASEFVNTLLSKYADSVEKTSELLQYIPKLAEKQLLIKQQRLVQYAWATDTMIVDRYTHPPKYSKKDERMKFCTLFYTCKAHFPSANADKDSIAGKAFFDEFVSVLKDKTAFDYTSADEWNWVYSTAGGADWLESVIVQHIDNNFVKPSDKTFRRHPIS